MLLMSVSPFCTVSHVMAANGGGEEEDGGAEEEEEQEKEEEEEEEECGGGEKASGWEAMNLPIMSSGAIDVQTRGR